jgi:hypothetical protein
MKTLLVHGDDPPPSDLRRILDRGSTSVDEVSASDLVTYVSRGGLGVDRLVFWAGAGDPDVRTLAMTYATAAGSERPQTVVFVTATPSEPLDGMTREEVLLWPRDADTLRLLFETGA